MGRTVAGIAVGCAALFALSAMANALVFHGAAPQRLAAVPLATLLLVMTALAAIAGGYLAAAIARRRPRTHGLAVGVASVLIVQLSPPWLSGVAMPAAGQPLWFAAAAMVTLLAGAALGASAQAETAGPRGAT